MTALSRSLSRRLGLAFFLILLSSGTLSAAEEVKSPAQSGQNSYPGTDICAVPSITAVRGNLLILSSGGTDNGSVEPALHFFDLSSRPDAPRLLSTVPLPGSVPQDLAFDGNTLYVAAPPQIFRIDISNPEKPLLTGSSSPSETPAAAVGGIAFDGKELFCAARRLSLKIFSPPESAFSGAPAAPPSASASFTSDFLRSIHRFGRHLYGANDVRGILIFDEKGKLLKRQNSGPGTAMRIRDDGQNLFLVNGSGGFQILAPADSHGYCAVLGKIPSLGTYECFGTFLFDIALDNGISPARHVYLAAGESGVAAADVSRPEKPAILSICPELFYAYIRSLAVSGQYLYANDDFFGLRVLSIADPASPKLIGPGVPFPKKKK